MELVWEYGIGLGVWNWFGKTERTLSDAEKYIISSYYIKLLIEYCFA
jgi:hypothetical protein